MVCIDCGSTLIAPGATFMGWMKVPPYVPVTECTGDELRRINPMNGQKWQTESRTISIFPDNWPRAQGPCPGPEPHRVTGSPGVQDPWGSGFCSGSFSSVAHAWRRPGTGSWAHQASTPFWTTSSDGGSCTSAWPPELMTIKRSSAGELLAKLLEGRSCTGGTTRHEAGFELSS